MTTDVLIIGQGICGTFLSLELERAGLSCIVIDEERPFTASRAAAGLINPVTGRRIVKTWMIDELLPFAREAYGKVGEKFGADFIRQVSVVDFFPTPQMRVAFLKRYEEDPQYLQLPEDDHSWDVCFRYELGYGLIGPCWLVDMPGLLGAARKRMVEKGVLRAERFELGELVVGATGPQVAGSRVAEPRVAGSRMVEEGLQAGGSVRYKDIDARWVIFCDGIESFTNPYFSRLPFAPNKGEALIVEVPDLAKVGSRAGQVNGDAERVSDDTGRVSGDAGQAIFKKGISLVPWKEGLYWVGSSYEWSFVDPGPTVVFRERMEAVLKEWLRLPFRTVKHFASVRPATLERRPFVGLHPLHPAVGILNGMGTKGCSLAPWFARQLVDRLSKGVSIQDDADILRFTKVLSRG